MCGICGKLAFDRDEVISPALVRSMADSIRHRGPDDEGYYVSGNVGLGFRRLSIIDLQTAISRFRTKMVRSGLCLMAKSITTRTCARFLLGKGHVFKTRTDTEVIVHLYEEFGPACLEKLRGMFSFAIWDGNAQTLFLARDRVGIKPLYYA